jgi:hypothetical protein
MGALVSLPVALVLYGAAPGPVWAMAALTGVGATYICVLSGTSTVVQLRAPAHLRARVVSLFFLALGILYPLGALVQGPISDWVGLGATTMGGGLALLMVVGLLHRTRPRWLRALDDLDAFPGPLPPGRSPAEVVPLAATDRRVVPDPGAAGAERAS